MTAVASVEDLRFSYGGADAAALDGIDLEVRAGEVLLLEGPSGGGKSTLLRALSGSVPHFHGGRFTGRVRVAGMDTLAASPARLARTAGLVFQDPESQAVMGSVERDVAFGPESAGVPAGAIPARVAEALEAVGAGHLAGRRIVALSGGERQRVALAAILACRPSLLLLDEPTSQLDEGGAAALRDIVAARAAEGMAVVLSEHRGDRVRAVADRALHVDRGRVDGGPAAGDAAGRGGTPAPGPALLRLEGITAGHGGRPVLADAHLELHAGTVTALAGPNGAGKTLLVRVAAGLHAPDAGRVLLDGRDVTAVPAERRFPRLALVSQDPGRHLLAERVGDEVEYALRCLAVPRWERRARVAASLEEFDLAALADRHPLDLSVGERERVALAATLVAGPGVIVLDEPTRGMDPARKARLATWLRARAAAGAAVLITTHDAAFAAAAADRRLRVDDVARRPGRP